MVGEKPNYDENSKVNIDNFNDSNENENEYYGADNRYADSDKDENDERILS